MRISYEDLKIAKVVGENEDGLTLFVPKDMSGVFHIDEGDKFLTILFVKQDGQGSAEIWTPWEGQ